MGTRGKLESQMYSVSGRGVHRSKNTHLRILLRNYAFVSRPDIPNTFPDIRVIFSSVAKTEAPSHLLEHIPELRPCHTGILRHCIQEALKRKRDRGEFPKRGVDKDLGTGWCLPW